MKPIRWTFYRLIDHYLCHYYETTRNALLITGARQIGKTYSIRQFGKTFKSFVEINFIETPEAVDLFRLYPIVGGMPAAVNKYIESNNLQEVMAEQQGIIRLYKRDIAKYDSHNKLYIEGIFNLIPPELNAKNKRFILKRLNEHAKFDRVENSFLWLTNAGVAQELVAHGIVSYYYNNKKRGELDFVIELGGKALPIEVKSGKDYETHRALSNIMDCNEYDLPEAIVFNNDNLQVIGKLSMLLSIW